MSKVSKLAPKAKLPTVEVKEPPHKGKSADEAVNVPPETADAVERFVDQPDEDEQEDEDDAKEEAEDFEDPLDGANYFQPGPVGDGNSVNDAETEGERLKVILEGARSSNPIYANLIPWDVVLSNIKDESDRTNLRLGGECLILAADLYGVDSAPEAHIWEELKLEIGLTRGIDAQAAKLLVTQIQESRISKKVKKQDERSNRGGLLGGMRREQPPGSQDVFD